MEDQTRKSASQVRLVSVSAEEAGQRIDNFLSRYLKGVPRSRIYRILRRGEVRVNRGRIPPRYKVRAGDTVRIPPVRLQPPRARVPPSERLAEITGQVLYENSRVLVLNKPAGIAVHGGSGLRYGVIEALRALHPEAAYLELVHRLDRDTSGCLMIARRRSALRELHAQLREGRVIKHYLALVRGVLQGTRRVDVPLRKNRLQGGERIVRVQADGKPAATVFRPLSQHRETTLVEAILETGRTHQIRVHAAHIDHPLAGDEKYGDAQFNRRMKEHGLKRMFLHAHMLEFTDPESGEPVNISAPLDEELKAVLDSLDSGRVPTDKE
jgi:23S rRNA pseudouridine955/2504/2580 synthase